MAAIRSRMVMCKVCQGTGGEAGPCRSCKGIGKIAVRVEPEVQSDRRRFFRGALITNHRLQKVR